MFSMVLTAQLSKTSIIAARVLFSRHVSVEQDGESYIYTKFCLAWDRRLQAWCSKATSAIDLRFKVPARKDQKFCFNWVKYKTQWDVSSFLFHFGPPIGTQTQHRWFWYLADIKIGKSFFNIFEERKKVSPNNNRELFTLFVYSVWFSWKNYMIKASAIISPRCYTHSSNKWLFVEQRAKLELDIWQVIILLVTLHLQSRQHRDISYSLL